MNIQYTTTEMYDRSIGAIKKWNWYFGDPNNPFNESELQNPTHTYPDSIGLYEVVLIVEDSMGCIDTTSKILSITDNYWIHIPSSFTPDLDQLNDKFCIHYHGIRETSFSFDVYSRFGDLVYSTNNISELNCNNGWNGEHQSTNKDLPAGAYMYKIYYQDFEGWKHQEMGHLFIIR